MLAYRAPEVPRIRVLISFADVMTASLLAADLRRGNELDLIQCSPDAMTLSASLRDQNPGILLFGTKSRQDAFTRLPMLRRLRKEFPNTRTVVVLDDSSPDLVAELFRAGVKGVFSRSEYDLERLCRCISSVASGQIWANSEQLGFVLDVFTETASLNIVSATGEQVLTRRERDVVKLVAEGYSNREISQQLHLSVHTVKNYLFNIFEKLGISSRAELVMYVLSNSDNSPARGEDLANWESGSLPTRKYTTGQERKHDRSELQIQSALAS